jgi:DNA-binding transcriptional ArsR family regulator
MDSAGSPESGLVPAPYGALPVGSGRGVWRRRPADEAESKALASTLRLRILRLALHEPRTNKQLAEALGRDPASVLHHVRTLVDTGFLVEQEVRRGPRGSRERPYLASGKSFYVETGGAATDARDLLLETFLQEVAALPPGQLDGARLGFRLKEADREEVRRRLRELLDDIAAMPSDPDGEPWSLYLAVHPEVGPTSP